MHAGGGMVTEDMDRSRRCSTGGLSRAAAACWTSKALRVNKARCITAAVLVLGSLQEGEATSDGWGDWAWLCLSENLRQTGLWPGGQGLCASFDAAWCTIANQIVMVKRRLGLFFLYGLYEHPSYGLNIFRSVRKYLLYLRAFQCPKFILFVAKKKRKKSEN